MPSVQPEDTALWLKLLHEGHEAKGIQQVLAKYRIVANSVSRNKIKAAFRYWKLLRDQNVLMQCKSFTILVSMLIMPIEKIKSM